MQMGFPCCGLEGKYGFSFHETQGKKNKQEKQSSWSVMLNINDSLLVILKGDFSLIKKQKLTPMKEMSELLQHWKT